MRVDKVILKAIISTVSAIVVLFAIMFGALVAAFPSTMMQITYNMGMNAVSAKYAHRAYGYSGDVYYAAFATEVSILDGDVEKVAEYGKLLIADDEFATYCDARNAQKTVF